MNDRQRNVLMWVGGIAVATLCLSVATAGNFATCAFDALPGIQNDPAAIAAWQTCFAKYPGGVNSIEQGSGRGWFGYDSGAECAAKKAADTRSTRAAVMIRAVCNRLYDEPVLDFTYDPNWKPPGSSRPKNYFDRFDPSTARPVQ